jgi:membrane-associated phospholipid phosphatase
VTPAGARVTATWLPFAVTLALARDRRVRHWEHTATRHLNQLPDALHYPLWIVMQTGTAAAPLVAGGVARAVGEPALAPRLTTSGTLAYLLAKGVKRIVGRGRPGDLVTGVLIRGRPATGDGYVSGHAAVSMALAVEAVPYARGWTRLLPITAASIVALARVYVGAHLPLDTLGGAALGWAISRTRHELEHRSHHRHGYGDKQR